MKHLFTTWKLAFVYSLLFLFASTSVMAQWDYVNFTEGTDRYLQSGCIDDSDNVYTYGADVGYTRVLRKFDSSGNLTWTKDISAQLDYASSVHIAAVGTDYTNGNVYTVGKTSNKGVIIESGVNAADVPTTWEQLGGTANSEIYDIKTEGNEMYVVGSFSNGSSSTVSFDSGSTTLTGSYGATFVAKYTISPKALVWAAKVDASNGVTGVNIDVDTNSNVYITGHFRGTAIFYNGGNSNIFNSTGNTYPDTFLAKFNSSGDFDTTFGLKTSSLNGNKRSYDVEISDLNSTVYWAESNNINAYDKDGSGAFLWTHTISNSSKVYALGTNNCGDVYATGQADAPVSRAPCGGDFFGLLLDSSTGATVWPSNATSCSSYGIEVMIDSNDKEVFVGSYFSSGSSQPIIIDGSNTSATAYGYFIGRYDDASYNSCCDTTIDLGEAVTVCGSGTFPVLDITSQINGNPTITWTLDGSVVQNGGTTLTTNSYGIYAVEVINSQTCIAIGSVEVNNDGCCDYDVDLGPNIEICEEDAWPVLDITGQVPGFTSIFWELNGQPFPQNANSETVTTIGAGTYTVIVEYNDGCIATDAVVVSVVSCEPDCAIYPNFKLQKKYCTISLQDISTTGAGTNIVGYLWDFGDGTTAVGPNVSHSYTSIGNYILTLTVYGVDENGNCCVETIQKGIQITKPCPEKCGLYPLIDMEKITNGAALFSSVSNTNAFTTIVGYEWTINGNIVSTDPFFGTPFNGGEVCLTVYGISTKDECCQETVCVYYDSPEGSKNALPSFDVYPNPSKGEVTINFSELNSDGSVSFEIYDLYGRLVHSGSTEELTEVIDNSGWATGVYMCMVKSNGEVLLKRILKE